MGTAPRQPLVWTDSMSTSLGESSHDTPIAPPRVRSV
jgi:hypothetical protein